jgi:hypothetical protein
VATTGRVALGMAAVATAGVFAWSLLIKPLPPVRSAADVAQMTAWVRPWLGETGAEQVHVGLDVHDGWPLAAGLILQLAKDGFDVSVDDQYRPLFGDHFRRSGREDAVIRLVAPRAGPPAALPGAERRGQMGVVSVWTADLR